MPPSNIDDGRYFDREGHPLTLMEWMILFEKKGYAKVAHTTTRSGVDVATSWMGLVHGNDSRGRPLIFETTTFFKGQDDGWQERYPTLEAAKRGHKRICKKYLDGMEKLLDYAKRKKKK